MSNSAIVPPDLLPTDQLLQDSCNSPDFLNECICKIVFSPCSKYLAVTKQDIDDRYIVLVIHCSDWHSSNVDTNELSIHNQFICAAPICSLAFGQRNSKLDSNTKSSLFHDTLFKKPRTRHELFGRDRSNSSVNHRHDFTKHLFLGAGLANGRINIWNIVTGELTLVLKDHKSIVCGLDFTSYTMQLASCSHDTTIKLWDLLDDGNRYSTLNEWTHVINAVKWSPDESLLCAIGPYELVVLFDTITWNQVYKLEGHLNTVVDCAFSSDSALLITASHDTRVLTWSTRTGECIKAFVHKHPMPLRIYAGGDNGAFVRSAVITKYNNFVITACDDNKVRWFSLALDSSSKAIYEQTETNVLCVAATPDGRTMALSYRNGEVHLYSTLLTLSTNQPLSLKSSCRLVINSHCGVQRTNVLELPLSQNLIDYLVYRDIKRK